MISFVSLNHDNILGHQRKNIPSSETSVSVYISKILRKSNLIFSIGQNSKIKVTFQCSIFCSQFIQYSLFNKNVQFCLGIHGYWFQGIPLQIPKSEVLETLIYYLWHNTVGPPQKVELGNLWIHRANCTGHLLRERHRDSFIH